MPLLIETEPKVCTNCGREFHRRPGYPMSLWRKARFCSHRCANEARRPPPATCRTCRKPIPNETRQRHRGWGYCSTGCAQSGKSVNPTTTRYRKLKRAGRKIAAHRFVMETALGRKLLTSEIVHHKNHDKLDNRLENLEIMTAPEHARLHAKR